MVPACLERTQAYSDTDDAKLKQGAIKVVADNEVKMSNIYKGKRQGKEQSWPAGPAATRVTG